MFIIYLMMFELLKEQTPIELQQMLTEHLCILSFVLIKRTIVRFNVQVAD